MDRARAAFAAHWPEYLMEAALLGLFMVSACIVVTVVQHPASPLRDRLVDPSVRRIIVGAAMGLTAIALIHSPWGQRSGAHFNPSVTLSFFRLGKIAGWDAMFYVLAQFMGGVAGMGVAGLLLGDVVADPAVRFVSTVPGPTGVAVAWAAELAISFAQMTLVLVLSNGRWARFTGVCAGLAVATWISIEAPFSGMSMNPARTFASAFSGNVYTALWVYFTAPVLGMLGAAELRQRVGRRVACAKLHHENRRRCIFCNRPAGSGVGSAPLR